MGKVDHLANIGKNISAHIAIGRADTSNQLDVMPGAASAVFSSDFESYKQRENFLSKASSADIKNDLVILRLKEPIEKFDASSCPQLPTEADCIEFRKYINASDRNNASAGSQVYRSQYYESGQGALKKLLSYPSSNLITTNISMINNLVDAKTKEPLGCFSIVYKSQAQDVFLKKGDSGAGFVWKNGNKKLIMGVQSATNRNFPEKSYVTSICNYLNHPNWAAFAAQTLTVTKPAEPAVTPAPAALPIAPTPNPTDIVK